MEFLDEIIDLLNSGKFQKIIDNIGDFLDENPAYKTIDYHHFANPLEEMLFDNYLGNFESIKTLDLDEPLEDIYTIYSIAYMNLGKINEAEKYLKIANQINPVSAPILIRLCEFYQSKHEEEKLKDLCCDIFKYAYDVDILTSSYFKLADYLYHTNQNIELYDHLFNFFVFLKSGEEQKPVKEDIICFRQNNIQVGVNPKIIQLLMYLIALYSQDNMLSTAGYFKHILNEVSEFNNYLNHLIGDEIDEQNVDELKNETINDNSRLEELTKEEITPIMQIEFLNILKESRLYMPVSYSENMFGGIENAKVGDVIEPTGQIGFNIEFLTDDKGNKVVPLFTSDEMMEAADFRSSTYVLYMSDLADMLKQTDRYALIAINPFTDYNINVPMETFLSLFNDENEISDIRNDEIRELLRQDSLSEDKLNEFGEKLLTSIMITGCVDADDGTNFVLIWDDDNKPHLPLFTDIDEFKKIFNNYERDIYPQAYQFKDLVNVANENIVINPASESIILNPEMFKN